MCYQGSSYRWASIVSDNGLAPKRQQAIIWTNDGLIYLRIYASLGLIEINSLTFYICNILICPWALFYMFINSTNGE